MALCCTMNKITRTLKVPAWMYYLLLGANFYAIVDLLSQLA